MDAKYKLLLILAARLSTAVLSASFQSVINAFSWRCLSWRGFN